MKKMERRKKRIERTLRSAVHTLLSGKQRISEGKKESKVLEDEISYLIEKLNELKSPKVKDMEARNCRHNFDKQASVLRRELEKFDDEVSEEVAERALFLWKWNNNHIENLIMQSRKVILSIVIPALERNAQNHWNQAVHSLTLNMRKIFHDLDPELFKECLAKFKEDESKQIETKAKREALSAMVFEAISTINDEKE